MPNKKFFAPSLDIANTEVGYAYLNHWQLKKAYALFKAINHPFVAKTGTRLLSLALELGLPIKPIVKSTMFAHFCGGETFDETMVLAEKLASFGVQVVLDYAVEAKERAEDWDRTTKEVIASLEAAARKPKIFPFAVFKMTGITSLTLLEKIASNSPLSPQEQGEWDQAKARVETIFQTAAKTQTPILVDAEESWIGKPIDDLVEAGMQRFNQEKPLIYQTVQMYRTDRLAYLHGLASRAKAQEFFLGIKLVRGAYHEKEILRATSLKIPIPVFRKKSDTDHAYDEALSFCLHNHANIALFLGTHNQTSTLKATQLMQELNLNKSSPNLYFSQLLGMSDPLTFNLAKHGFLVCKYVPYGPLRDAVPYLIRRAEENSSVAGQSSRELELITKEMKRRSSH